MYLRPISPFEILCVIKQLNSNKSCGLDGIDAKFVQLAAEAIAIFILCYRSCTVFAIQWRTQDFSMGGFSKVTSKICSRSILWRINNLA